MIESYSVRISMTLHAKLLICVADVVAKQQRYLKRQMSILSTSIIHLHIFVMGW